MSPRENRTARAPVSPTVIRRPQRTLTKEDYEALRKTPLLNLTGALIMGIADPVPNPSPMAEDEGAWVREHAWPAHFQKTERKYPFGFQRWSTCELGTCWNCLSGRCDLCVHRQNGGPHHDNNTDWVWSSRGRCVSQLILRPGGEPCLWWCRCSCPKYGPGPTAPAPAAAEDVAAKPVAELHPHRRPSPRGQGADGQEALF
ncbi:DUF6248 family natural product biosynthesis protein [Streptomyces niveus]|uniref:DUF6248 family natural product biosynthesis protein n=1 Tax=Streptomyces niveus TaxID=193462 RepID=UPI0036AC636E